MRNTYQSKSEHSKRAKFSYKIHKTDRKTNRLKISKAKTVQQHFTIFNFFIYIQLWNYYLFAMRKWCPLGKTTDPSSISLGRLYKAFRTNSERVPIFHNPALFPVKRCWEDLEIWKDETFQYLPFDLLANICLARVHYATFGRGLHIKFQGCI